MCLCFQVINDTEQVTARHILWPENGVTKVTQHPAVSVFQPRYCVLVTVGAAQQGTETFLCNQNDIVFAEI